MSLNNIVTIKYTPSQVCNGVCISRSQNLTVVSPDPLANFLLSGLNWTDITASACPGNELKSMIYQK